MRASGVSTAAVTTIVEMPLDMPKAQGPVIDTWVTRVHPGRFEDAMAFTAEATPLAVENGAIGVHLYLMGAAGSESGRSVWTAEYESFEAYGTGLDKQATSAKARDVMAHIMSADSPMEVVQHTLMHEIPLH